MTAFRFVQRLSDPFGFEDALRELALTPDDFPGLYRDFRGLDA